MILTCPACDTKYVVKDGAIPAGGRQVRCASCKHSWHQDPEFAVDESVTIPAGGAGAPLSPTTAGPEAEAAKAELDAPSETMTADNLQPVLSGGSEAEWEAMRRF